MARRKGARAEAETGTDAEAAGPAPGFGLVLPLSLLAGGLAAYPALSAAAEGRTDLVRAATIFLTATLVAVIGFGLVAVLFVSFSAAHTRAEQEEREREREAQQAARAAAGETGEGGPLPLAITELDHQADDIGEALAATDALLHEDSRAP